MRYSSGFGWESGRVFSKSIVCGVGGAALFALGFLFAPAVFAQGVGPTISSLSPNSGVIGTQVAINGPLFSTSTSYTINFGPGFVSVPPNVSGNGGSIMFSVPGSLVQTCFLKGTCAQETVAVQPGTYAVSVVDQSGLTSNSVNFTVLAGNPVSSSLQQVSISSLSPASNSIGTLVSVSGTGFTAYNGVRFGNGLLQGPAYSTDGVSTAFNVPAQIIPSCRFVINAPCTSPIVATTPGTYYNVAIVNSNGAISNALPFLVTTTTVVTAGTIPPPPIQQVSAPPAPVPIPVINTSTAPAPPPPPPPPPGAKFAIGDTVQVLTDQHVGLNVRSAPSISASIVGTEQDLFLGTVIGGPVSADNYTWWQINYDDGVSGWSVENFLIKVSRNSVSSSSTTSGNTVNFSNVNVINITDTSATVTFATDVSVTAQVLWGTNGALNNSDSATGPFTGHVHVLTGLTPGTTYNFKIAAYAGYLVYSQMYTFTTTGTPPPTAPACNPGTQTLSLNTPMNFSATGGNGTFSWSAANGTPASGSGANFSTTYATAGNYSVTVTSNGQTATCAVTTSLPLAISNVTVTNITNTAADVNFTTNIAATAQVLWGTNGAFNNSDSATGPFTTHLHHLTGLTPGTTYNFKIAAYGGTLVYSATYTFTTLGNSPTACMPGTQTVSTSTPAAFSASGGNGTYSWSAPSAVPASGSGVNFSVVYPIPGNYSATVTSNGQSATCAATVTAGQGTSLAISNVAATNITNTAADVNFTTNIAATAQVLWGTNGAFNNSDSATGPFTTHLHHLTGLTPGTTYNYEVAAYSVNTVYSPSYTFTTTGTAPTSTLLCVPSTQGVTTSAPVGVSASGGNGTYSWAAPGGTINAGSGANFSTTYAAVGTYTATVTSGAQTANCTITVTPAPVFPTCTPGSQAVAVNKPVSFTAGAGNGTYSWSASGGTPASGSGASFSTTYATAGNYSATVTSNGLSAACVVTVTVVGSRVQVFSTDVLGLNVRTQASINASITGHEQNGQMGTVAGGPVSADGYNWLQVNYDDGQSGWSAENYLLLQ